MTQEFILAWPPSLNALYRTVQGRILLSREGRAWKAQAGWELRVQQNQQGQGAGPLTGRLAVVIEVYPPNRRAFDLDNRLKVALDAGNGVLWADDHQIDDLRIVRMPPAAPGYLRLRLSAL